MRRRSPPCAASSAPSASAPAVSVSETGADFIKTSTGYGTRGASADDIRLFKKYLTGPVKIKASGGIRSAADAQMYLSLGCERLGTSSGVAIARELAAQA